VAEADYWAAASVYSAISDRRGDPNMPTADRAMLAKLIDSTWYGRDASDVAARFTRAHTWAHGSPGAGGGAPQIVGQEKEPPVKRPPKEKEESKFVCCPEKIVVTSESGAKNENTCSPNWKIEVVATWLGTGTRNGKPCSCDCCEVRQFISDEATKSLTPKGGKTTSNRDSAAKLVRGPKLSDAEWLRDHPGGIKDFKLEHLSPFKLSDSISATTNGGKNNKYPGVDSQGRRTGEVRSESAVRQNEYDWRMAASPLQLNRVQVKGKNGKYSTKYWREDVTWSKGGDIYRQNSIPPTVKKLLEEQRPADDAPGEEIKDWEKKVESALSQYGIDKNLEPWDGKDQAKDAKRQPCEWKYSDKPKGGECGPQADGATITETLKFEFAIVIRPAPNCGGEILEYRCALAGGCKRVGTAPCDLIDGGTSDC